MNNKAMVNINMSWFLTHAVELCTVYQCHDGSDSSDEWMFMHFDSVRAISVPMCVGSMCIVILPVWWLLQLRWLQRWKQLQ